MDGYKESSPLLSHEVPPQYRGEDVPPSKNSVQYNWDDIENLRYDIENLPPILDCRLIILFVVS